MIFLSRAGASGSHHLPWALLRVLHADAKIKRLASGSGGRGCGRVCSKAAGSVFIRGRQPSGIAAGAVARRRGNGGGGKRSRSTALPPAARRNATAKASVTGNGSNTGKPGKQQSQRQLILKDHCLSAASDVNPRNVIAARRAFVIDKSAVG